MRRAWVVGLGLLLGQMAAVAQQPLRRVFVFGDSYSDTGRGWVDGNGPTAVQYAADRLGWRMVASNRVFAATEDSVNFAVSGAQTGSHAGREVPGGVLGFGMENQVAEFAGMMQAGKIAFDPKTTLFFLEGGLNDGGLQTEQTVANLTGEAKTLYALGARRFAVAVLPEMIPAFHGVAARLNPALKALPGELEAKLPGAEVTSSQWGADFDAVMVDAAKDGFTDTTHACAGRSIFHEDTTPCAKPGTYFYFHKDHPSTAVQKLVSVALAEEWRMPLGKPVRMALWPSGVPLAKGTGDADVPWMEAYLPLANPTRTAVMICPGGGYGGLAMDHEGSQVAEWLRQRGVAAFVLKYRVAPYGYPVPMLDAERGLRMIRAGAAGFGVEPGRIGIWGFSAGGHLSSFLLTHFDEKLPAEGEVPDAVDTVSVRPDFGVLGYPVISMKPGITHAGSRTNLLGAHPDPALEEALSDDQQVKPTSPPLFLFSTSDDGSVPVENSVLLYMGYVRAKVPVEMHLFEHGGHGSGLAARLPGASAWPDLLENWMQRHGWMAGTAR